MPLPDQIAKLIESEISKNCEKDKDKQGFYHMTLRQGVDQKDIKYTLEEAEGNKVDLSNRYQLLPKEEGDKILEYWNQFHELCKCKYDSFEMFYIKNIFCRSSHLDEISEETFLTLIADRTFLFMEYNQHSTNEKYPTLFRVCKDYILVGCKDQARYIRDNGFAPTTAHRTSYERLLENRRKLEEAIERREEHIKRWKRNEALNQKGFSVALDDMYQTNGTEDMKIKKLSCLFYAYLKAMVDRGYRYEYKKYASSEDNADQKSGASTCVEHEWIREIGLVHQKLVKLKVSGTVLNPAIVYFDLFANYTSKLAKHKLTTYKFRMPSPSKRAEDRRVPLTISRKIECQIILYDYLLDLFFPDDDREQAYAKYEFYAATHYQWYMHYQLPEKPEQSEVSNMKQKSDQIEALPNFHLLPDLEDGVDELGHIMRRNIELCLPNGYEWLAMKPLYARYQDNIHTKTLLLEEACLRLPSQRMITKVRNYIKRIQESRNLLEEYAEREADPHEVIKLLDPICREKEFRFHSETALSEYTPISADRRIEYTRLILEHELRAQLNEAAHKKLFRVAHRYFAKLFVTKDPFGINE